MKKRFLVYISTILVVAVAVMTFVPLFGAPVSNNHVQSRLPSGQVAKDYSSDATLTTTAVSSILMEADSHSIIFARNENLKAGMASTTKIMTALVVLETLPLDKTVKIPKEAVGVEGSSIYLTEGETLTVRELLYGLLLESGNDSAVALAIAAGGSVEKFVEMMNSKAGELGLKDTHFANPHGLSDPNHYTTAHSLAIITAAALENPTFKEIVSTKRMTLTGSDGQISRYFVNHNKLLFSYDGLIGVKTGFTKATGRCLVTAAERDGILLIAVTLNDSNDWVSHRAMLNYGYSEYERVNMTEDTQISISVSVVGGITTTVNAVNTAPAQAVLKKGSTYTCKYSCPHFLYAPVNKGDIVGYAEYYDGKGELFYRLPLVADQTVEYKKLTLFEKIFG